MIKRTLFLIPVVLCPLGTALAADWPQWRGPDRTGISKETGLLPSWPPGGPKLLWTFRDAGMAHSSMAIVGDRLYSIGAQGNKEYVYALDVNTPKKLWSVEIGAPFASQGYGNYPRGTPSINGNLLYAIGSQGNLVCVDTTTGKKVWSQEMATRLGGTPGKYGYCDSPLVDGDQVVATLGGKTNVIVAFDKKTGKVKWRSTIYTGGDEHYSTISSMMVIESGGVRQYVHVAYRQDANVIGVRASDGKILWQIPAPCTVNTPIFHNGCVYVSASYCKLIKLTPKGDNFKAELVYDKHEMENEHGGVILVGDYLYGFTKKGHGWMCQDFKRGKPVWRGKPTSPTVENPRVRRDMGRGSVTYADGNLYCYHEIKGDVLLIKATPEGYQEQGKFRIPEHSKSRGAGEEIWAHPVVANGKLYLRDQELIFCYDIKDVNQNAPLPKPAAAATPKTDAARRETARRALAWLLLAMKRKDWDKDISQDGNAQAHRYIATLMTAWLLEANADFPEFEKMRDAYRKRADHLLSKNVTFKFHTTWCDGFAGLYAYERSLREGKAHPALDRIARSIVAEQNAEGGWNHTKNFTKILPGYSPTVLAVANLALVSLGAAERMKVPFADNEKFKKSVKDGLGLFRKSQRPNGGIPYGRNPLYGDSEAGRTAGFLLALSALGRTDTDMFRRAATYFLRNSGSIPEGHGCTPLHFFMGSVACYILSDDAFREYDVKVLEQARKLQREEGDFEKGKDFTGPSSDFFDKAYTASLYALAMSVDRMEVARKLRLSVPFQR